VSLVAAAARVEELFEKNASDAPGCAVGVVANGDVVFAKGYGLASLEHGVRITRATRFYMASVSKQVTALAVLLAAEQGALSLTDSIRNTVPELPRYMDAVTLRHLLTHTGGVRDYFPLGWLAGLSAEHAYTESDVLGIVGRQRALNFPPGADVLYSNSGYVLLSIAIARAAGRRLDAFAREVIFGPLGMDAARFQHDHADVVPDKASGYEQRDGAWRVANSMLDVVGDGGMYASLDDMLAWTRNLLSPQLGASAIGVMQTPARLRGGASTGYGMGLGIAAHRGLKTLEHGGGMAGYRTHLLAYPTESLGVVVLGNDGTLWPGQLARRMGEAYLGERMAPASPRPPSPPIAEIKARAGVYRAQSGDVLSLAEQDGKLRLHEIPQPLWPLGPASFALGGDRDVLSLAFETSGDAFVLAQGGGPDRRYERCEPPEQVDTDPFLGDFVSREVAAGCTVRRSGANLGVSFAGGPEVGLRPVAPDCLLADDFGATLTLRRGRSGAVRGFDLDAGRLRRVAYRRVRSAAFPLP
jgi:CubicO group peptidase (beta-lactamase class C family)